MAGTLPGFDADDFRKQIRFVMNMGAPIEDDRQATFYFKDNVTSTAPTDSQGVPFAPATVVREPSKAPIKVNIGVEFQRGPGSTTAVGPFEADRAIITLLDEDYVKVVGFTHMTLAGREWKLNQRELMEYALGPVGVHQVLCEAVD